MSLCPVVVDGIVCGRPHHAGGMCSTHFQRKKRLGDPLAPVQLRGADPAVRFVSKVDVNGPVPAHDPSLGPCHVWTDALNRLGYGLFHINGRTVQIHRLSYELFVGPIPDGMNINHHCDNRACVRPSHLYVGTQKQNMEDAVRRGRSARGSRSGKAKLTEWDVRDIREMWANDTCTMTQKEIGAGYGVSGSCIGGIVNRDPRRWAWVEDL